MPGIKDALRLFAMEVMQAAQLAEWNAKLEERVRFAKKSGVTVSAVTAASGE